MAKKNTNDETALAIPNVSADLGAVTASDFGNLISEAGFVSIESVRFGDAANDKIPLYVGKLLGPGRPVVVGEPDPKTGEVSTMPTWKFQPVIGKDDAGNLVFSDNVTHIAPCNYQVDAACSDFWDQDQGKATGRVVGIAFIERTTTRKGRQLNRYRIFSKPADNTVTVPTT